LGEEAMPDAWWEVNRATEGKQKRMEAWSTKRGVLGAKETGKSHYKKTPGADVDSGRS